MYPVARGASVRPASAPPREWPMAANGPSATALAKRAAVGAAYGMPAVARPHEAVNRDTERGDVSARKRKHRGPSLTPAQTERLAKVYFLNLKAIAVWLQVRRAVAVYVLDRHGVRQRRAHWQPPPPSIPWQKISLDPAFGIFVPVDTAKQWIHAYGKRLRAAYRKGELEGWPEYVVRGSDSTLRRLVCRLRRLEPARVCAECSVWIVPERRAPVVCADDQRRQVRRAAARG